MAKKRGKRNSRKVVKKVLSSQKMVRSNSKKIGLVFKNLILFLVFSLIFVALYSISSNEFMINLFFLLSVLFGFVTLAFLLALLVFLVLKMLKR